MKNAPSHPRLTIPGDVRRLGLIRVHPCESVAQIEFFRILPTLEQVSPGWNGKPARLPSVTMLTTQTHLAADLTTSAPGVASTYSTHPSIISVSLSDPHRTTLAGSGFSGLFAELSKCAVITRRVPFGMEIR